MNANVRVRLDVAQARFEAVTLAHRASLLILSASTAAADQRDEDALRDLREAEAALVRARQHLMTARDLSTVVRR